MCGGGGGGSRGGVGSKGGRGRGGFGAGNRSRDQASSLAGRQDSQTGRVSTRLKSDTEMGIQNAIAGAFGSLLGSTLGPAGSMAGSAALKAASRSENTFGVDVDSGNRIGDKEGRDQGGQGNKISSSRLVAETGKAASEGKTPAAAAAAAKRKKTKTTLAGAKVAAETLKTKLGQ